MSLGGPTLRMLYRTTVGTTNPSPPAPILIGAGDSRGMEVTTYEQTDFCSPTLAVWTVYLPAHLASPYRGTAAALPPLPGIQHHAYVRAAREEKPPITIGGLRSPPEYPDTVGGL